MKHFFALILALMMIAGMAAAGAQSFTPITVEGGNYLNNVDTCIASIGEITLEKDETFSFNCAVGARSEERGYCAAPNGRGVEVVGGGVGQVATTIYLSVKHMDSIEVVEKNTYGSDFCVDYAPNGDDALIADYDQAVDFKFTNRGEPVTISVWREDSRIYCDVTEVQQSETAAGEIPAE